MLLTEPDKLQYPIGRFVKPDIVTQELIAKYISIISEFPDKLKHEVAYLSNEQLDTVYRPQGWTIRQVIHHCADSHINSFTRFKLALTEERPTIKPYCGDKWAELADSKAMPVEASLILLEGLHYRWTYLLNSLTNIELDREFIHPEYNKTIKLKDNIAMYAWHCEHHLAHITELKKSRNW